MPTERLQNVLHVDLQHLARCHRVLLPKRKYPRGTWDYGCNAPKHHCFFYVLLGGRERIQRTQTCSKKNHFCVLLHVVLLCGATVHCQAVFCAPTIKPGPFPRHLARELLKKVCSALILPRMPECIRGASRLLFDKTRHLQSPCTFAFTTYDGSCISVDVTTPGL